MDDSTILVFAFVPFGVLLALRLLLGRSEPGAGPWLRALMFEHLALAAARGLPLGGALDALARERERCAVPGRRLFGRRDPARVEADMLRALAARHQATGSLAAALSDVREVAASPTDVEVIRIAEARGALPEVLAALDREHAARVDARHDVIELVWYPGVVVLLVGMIGMFMGLTIVPKFRVIADSIGVVAEPRLGAADVLTVVLFGGSSLLLVDEVMLRRAGRVGRAVQRLATTLACRAPVVGAPLRRRLHARWLLRASALLEAGTTLPEALDVVARLDDGPTGRDLRRAADLAAQGHAVRPVLAAALGRDADALVAPLLLAVDAAGAPAGLRAGAERMARVASARLVAAGRTLQVVPILFCAAIVGVHSVSVWAFLGAVEATILGELR